jgi:thioesterase domain-containing protein
LVESKEREIQMIKEIKQRESALEELLAPLNQEKQEVMRNLLESVQTARLSNAFEKYLPAVLEDRSAKARQVIKETVSVATGDKSVRSQDADDIAETQSNVIDLKRLAGL